MALSDHKIIGGILIEALLLTGALTSHYLTVDGYLWYQYWIIYNIVILFIIIYSNLTGS